jgi:predicted HTH transcriptional regulator
MNFVRKTSHIQNLIEQGEGLHLDFKYAVNDSKKIARSLSAFANTEGGVLLLGVRDNGSIAGVKSEEEFYMIEAAAEIYTQPKVNFSMKQHNVGGLTVLEIIIEKSENKPHFAPDTAGHLRAYVRVNDENIMANRLLLNIWKKQKSSFAVKIKYSEAESALLNYLSKNPTISFSKLCRIADVSRFTAEKMLVGLICAGIIKYEFEAQNLVFRLND